MAGDICGRWELGDDEGVLALQKCDESLAYIHARTSVLGRWNHLKDEWSFLAAARAAMGVAIGMVG